jgi:hypothetical protein
VSKQGLTVRHSGSNHSLIEVNARLPEAVKRPEIGGLHKQKTARRVQAGGVSMRWR